MFHESLETRRFLSVTLRPPTPPGNSGNPGTGTPDCVVVTEDAYGNVVIGTKDGTSGNHGFIKCHNLCQWFKGCDGRWHYGHTSGGSSNLCGGSSTTMNNCTMGVAVMEDHGTLVVTEISTGATWDVTNAKTVTINGTDNADDIFYTGNSIGANINAGGGDDSITVADTGTGSSNVNGGDGDDSINLLVGHNSYIDGGGGNDVIYVNSGAGVYNVNNATAIIEGGSGNDTIIVYDGKATVDGGSGNDQALVYSSDGAHASVSSATTTTA